MELNKETKGIIAYNTTRESMSEASKNLLPVGTPDNIGGIANIFLRNPSALNEFWGAISNKVGYTRLNSVRAKSPLSFLKHIGDGLGNTTEDVYIGLQEEHDYNPAVAENEVFKQEKPNIQAAYHIRNREKYYKSTATQAQTRNAFTSWTTLYDVYNAIFNSLAESNKRDENKYFTELTKIALDNGHMGMVEVGKVPTSGDQTSIHAYYNNVIALIKEVGYDMEYPNDNTPMGVENSTPEDEQILLMTNKMKAQVSVQVLSEAFNMSEVDLSKKSITVQSLGDPNIVAALVSKRFYIINEDLFQTGAIYNPQGLYTNNFLHVWQTISYSMFNNAIAFVQEIPTALNDRIIVQSNTGFILGGYGTKTSTLTYEMKEYNATGTTWKYTVSSDYDVVIPTLTSDSNTTGKISLALDDAKTAEPNRNFIVKITATAVDETGNVVASAPVVTREWPMSISMYVNVGK